MTTLLGDKPSITARSVRLKMSEAELPVDSFDLPEGKCTIGSSPSCQIRLTAGQARPLQCLVVRSGTEITVTRWAPGILLNGAEFTSAPLQNGDCLSIGAVKLQLATAEEEVAEAKSVEQSSVALLDKVEAQVAAEVATADGVTEAASAPPQADATAEADLAKLHSANQQARQRFRRLIGTLRELREESRGLDQHVNVLTAQLEVAQQAQAKLSTELVQVQAIAIERESQFSEELDRAIAELSSSYEKANTAEQSLQHAVAHREQLQDHVAALTAECERLQSFQAASAAEKQFLEEELASREQQLQGLRDEFMLVQQGLESSIAELDEQNQTLRAQLAQVTTEFERHFAEYQQELEHAQAAAAEQSQRLADAQKKQFEEQVAALGDERTRLEELHAATVSEKDRLEQELSQRDAQLDQLRSDLAQVQEGLEDSVAELHEQNQALREQLAQISADRDQQLTRLSAERDEQLADREQRLAELQQGLQAAQEEARQAKTQRDTPDPVLIELEEELTVVRGERQQFANENHRLSEQITDAEKRIRLLEIDVRSANTEWQRAQSAAARLQEDILTAEAHIADMDAKLADMACTTEVEHVTECDQITGQLAELRQQVAAREQALTELAAEREQFAVQLATVEQELVERQEHLAEVYRQLSDLQSHATEAEKAHTQLAAELSDREARVAEVTAELKHAQEQLAAQATAQDALLAELNRELSQEREESAAELTARESQIAKLSNQLNQTQERITAELNSREARVAELSTQLAQEREQRSTDQETRKTQLAGLTGELSQTQKQLADELEKRDNRIEELDNKLKVAQERVTFDLATREGELARELKRTREEAAAELASRETRIGELADELQQVQEQLTAELNVRDARNTDLVQELRQTQDQLVECAAQGERLNELYQQAQSELATAAQNLLRQEVGEIDAAVDASEVSEIPPAAPSLPVEDPRDEHELRIVHTFVSTIDEEPENEEAETVEEFQPASFIDHYSHIFEEEGGLADPEPAAARSAQRKQHEIAAAEAGDESALLEAYMANMMKRVRGESSSETVTPPLARVQLADGETAQSNPVERMMTLTRRVSAPEVSEPVADQGLINLQQLKGTSRKPPLPTSLTAMRELANISARQAIAKHRKRRHYEGALSKLLVSAIAGGTAGYMLLTAESYTSTYFLAGCGVAIVSGFWGFKLLGILLEMVRDGINDERTPAELSELEEPLPIDGTAE